jgi:hypothetical protein
MPLLITVIDPGLMPGFESLTNGDIKRKRTMLAEVCRCRYGFKNVLTMIFER